MNPSAYGRDIRFARLFSRRSGRAIVVAWAHGPLLGPIPGTEREAIERLAGDLAEADALLVSPSMLSGLRDVLSRRERPMIFMLSHWQSVSRPSGLLGYEEGATAPLMRVEDAARLGADGVMSYLYVGWEDPAREREEISYVAEVTRRCHDAGLLHMVESRAVRSELDANGLARADLVSYHTRLAAELGADLVKTKWTGAETFATIVDATPVPLLTAGGPRTDSLDQALAEAAAILGCGARGLVWGRNIYQRPDPRDALGRVIRLLESHPGGRT